MKLHGTITATWVLMVGVEMLMKGPNYVEERLNLLLLKNSWLVDLRKCSRLCEDEILFA